MADRIVRACLITNPRSGHGGIDLSTALPILNAHGWHISVRQKLHGGDATKLARAAAREGYDVVVNCGGDGTLSEIVDGLVGTDVAVGTLPGGTINLWARELGIARDLGAAARQLVGAEPRRVDVGHLTVNGKHDRHFLLMAGLGLDGAVIAGVSKPLKNRIGPLAVGLAALRALPGFHVVPVRVEIDDVQWYGRVSQIVIGNTRRYAGFTRITGGAYIDDGLLDLCLITAAGPISGVRQLTAMLLRQRPSSTSAELYRAAAITIHAPVKLPLQVDGGAERLKKARPTAEGMIYRFTVVARGITVLLPRTYNGELFAPGRHSDLPHEAKGKQARREDASEEDAGHGSTTERQLVVMRIEGDVITAAHGDTGRLVRVQTHPKTVFERRTLAGSQGIEPLVREGDTIRVKGKKDHDSGAINAARVILVSTQETSGPEDIYRV